MNRLEKKCLIVSVGTHLVLAAILVISPAFVTSKNRSIDLPPINFIPLKIVDSNVTGGGNPNARPPPSPPVAKPQPVATAQPPAPKPEPEKPLPPKPEIAKVEKAEVVKSEPDSLEPSKEPRHRKPEISMKVITRRPSSRLDSKTKKQADDTERQVADARQRLARQIGKVAESLGNELSSSTKVELDDSYGPGGGGPPYANFLQAVKSVYERAWTVPDGAVDDDATAVAEVTIARDSTVLSFRIVQFSGRAPLDRSVQHTLERVKYAAPLPEGTREDKRTVTINFNAKAKRSLG